MSLEVFEVVPELTTGTKKEIIDELNRIGVGKISYVEYVPSKTGMTLKVVSDFGKEYYVGISTYGFLEIIREDSKVGKIVYMPIDD